MYLGHPCLYVFVPALCTLINQLSRAILASRCFRRQAQISDSIGSFFVQVAQNKNLCCIFGILYTLLFLIYRYAAVLRVREKSGRVDDDRGERSSHVLSKRLEGGGGSKFYCLMFQIQGLHTLCLLVEPGVLPAPHDSLLV